MGALFEDVVAALVVLLVGGAIVGMVFKLLWGNRGEEKALQDIASKYGEAPKGGGKGKGGKKGK